MAKHEFEMEFEITGLKLKIKGSRDDIPTITQAVGNQIAGMLSPATDIVDGEVVGTESEEQVATPQKESPKRKPNRGRKPKAKNSVDSDNKAIIWKHNPEKYGTPKPEWTGTQKIVWLLYVVSQESDAKQLTPIQIGATFDAHFKQAKKPANIARDLGRQKLAIDTPVAEDTSVSPSTWYLTQQGEKQAKDLIAGLLGKN